MGRLIVKSSPGRKAISKPYIKKQAAVVFRLVGDLE